MCVCLCVLVRVCIFVHVFVCLLARLVGCVSVCLSLCLIVCFEAQQPFWGGRKANHKMEGHTCKAPVAAVLSRGVSKSKALALEPAT